MVKRECHLIAVEIDLERAVDRLPDNGELIQRGPKQPPLYVTADHRDQNDEPGMQRLGSIKLPEVACVVGDDNKITVAGVAHNIPVLPAGTAYMRDMLGFMAGFPGDSDQVDAEAFVDQKPHNTAIASSFRRPRRTGC